MTKNERLCVKTREEIDANDGIKHKEKFPETVMVWLEACSKGVSPRVIFENDTWLHDCIRY